MQRSARFRQRPSALSWYLTHGNLVDMLSDGIEEDETIMSGDSHVANLFHQDHSDFSLHFWHLPFFQLPIRADPA